MPKSSLIPHPVTVRTAIQKAIADLNSHLRHIDTEADDEICDAVTALETADGHLGNALSKIDVGEGFRALREANADRAAHIASVL